MTSKMELLSEIKESKLIAAIGLEDPNSAVSLAKCMIEGGVKFIEFTFRNPKTEECLLKLKESNLPVHYGAGTVRTLEQAKKAVAAGAEFIVAPGFNKEIVRWANDNSILIVPGIDSTLGIEYALEMGLNTLKFFPATVAGGTDWLKAIKGPYFDVDFIPTGGINIDNMVDFLKMPNVIAVAGSFLAPKKLINQKDFDAIKEICKIASSKAKSA